MVYGLGSLSPSVPLLHTGVSFPTLLCSINFLRPETPQEPLVSGCLEANSAPPVPGMLAKSWRAG